MEQQREEHAVRDDRSHSLGERERNFREYEAFEAEQRRRLESYREHLTELERAERVPLG